MGRVDRDSMHFFSCVFTRGNHSNFKVVQQYNYPIMAPINISAERHWGPYKQNYYDLLVVFTISSLSCQKQSIRATRDPQCFNFYAFPIFKSGDKHELDNYRPISLTAVPCRLLEHIIAQHIYSHLVKSNILFEKQLQETFFFAIQWSLHPTHTAI